MNEQEEILVRQSNWSGRRVVLFYWFAIVFVGTAAAAGLGTTILDPRYKFEAADDHAAIGDPWHPDDCAGCHDDIIASWNETWHARLVGEFDPGDISLNGSKVSFNGTHYWRTPNSAFMQPTYWTYNQLYNATGQQCCMTTRWYNVTLINATTGEVLAFNATLSAELNGYTSNIWDIGVSCAACHAEPGEVDLSYRGCSGGNSPPCHTPGGGQWSAYIQSEHYNSLNDLLASGDINSLTVLGHHIGQSTYMNVADLNASEWYTITCVTCHDPHDSSINAADESNAMSPWTNPYTGQVFGPGGSQLRAATVNELCGICHDISLNTSTAYFTDPSNHTMLACTDCHGYRYTPPTYFPNGTIEEPGEFSSLSHNWRFSGGAPGEVCGLCHGNDNATVWATMQTYLANFGNLTDAKALYDTKLTEATAKYDEAKSTVGVNTSNLANAKALIEEAEDLVPLDGTFHNPLSPTAEEQLALALVKLDEAISEADAAIANAINPTVTLDNTVDHTVDKTVEKTVEKTVDHTVDKTVEKTVTESTPAIGLLAVLGILGATAFLVRKRRR